MAKRSIIYYLSSCLILLLSCECSINRALDIFDDGRIEYMSREERDALKQEAKEMFFHAYNAYMNNAYPADELMPLSCKGRYRGSEPDRGDMDSTLGNFSLTLVDTLDTLVVMGNLGEFERAVKLVIKDVTFDTDVIVSLFETNIRMLGGLLSGHILANYIKQRENAMPWYKGELLNLAKDLGFRFLPAFNTTTGIPFGRINLKYGMKGVPLELTRETCTACAGSMILEMAALSRLTGESIFEEKAQKAMDVLWKLRHRGTDLMGSVLNVNSGDWVRRDSGVGAGIDSYYEYCLKAYILLGDEKYLGRFNKHYQAIMKYISQGPMLLDVHMHRPNTNSKNFMDALLAFWPGLQVLKGDIKPAVETHEMLYQVMQRHNFIPEAFTTDFQVHWGHHPLRPEFLESTYFLYKATGDHYYLGVGRKVLKSLQTYARVPCGFAAVSDVRTNKHDDTMDSFVLSETFKYLFLLFADPNDLILNLDEYVFTTEGHLLPLSLASVRINATTEMEREKVHVEETDRTCPNSLHLFPASVRQPLRNMVEDVCPKRAAKKRLSASQFQPSNLEHVKMLNDMGIVILTAGDGSIKFLQTLSSAKSPHDAEEGQLFMQEILELNKQQNSQMETHPILVTFVKPNTQPPQKVSLLGGPAQFGVDLKNTKITGNVVVANPSLACDKLDNADQLKDMIAIVDRGSCQFIDKARRIQKAGAIAGIVLDNTPTTSIENSILFAMSPDGKSIDDVTIPFVFLFGVEASQLGQAMISSYGHLTVTISGVIQKDFRNENQLKPPTDLSLIDLLKSTFRQILTRQTSQNLSSSRSVTKVPGVISTIDEEQLNFAYLQANIANETPDQFVEISLNVKKLDTYFETPKNIFTNESSWLLMKKILVNELFGMVKLNFGFRIQTSGITKFYSLIMSKRGIDDKTIKSTSLPKKILWFLKELSQVNPDAAIVSLYQDVYPEVDKQYFLAYLFRISAFSIKKYFNYEVVKQIEDSDKLSLENLINIIISKTYKVQSNEFEKFMKKYVPLMINYIALYSINTLDDPSEESPETDVFSVNEFITKISVLNIDPLRIFSNEKWKKKSAEISKHKEGVIRIELASQLDELLEDFKDTTSQINNKNDNLLEDKESVPNTQIKDTNSNNILSEPQESITQSSIDSHQASKSKNENEHIHDDL